MHSIRIPQRFRDLDFKYWIWYLSQKQTNIWTLSVGLKIFLQKHCQDLTIKLPTLRVTIHCCITFYCEFSRPDKQAVESIHFNSCPTLSSPRWLAWHGSTIWLFFTSVGFLYPSSLSSTSRGSCTAPVCFSPDILTHKCTDRRHRKHSGTRSCCCVNLIFTRGLTSISHILMIYQHDLILQMSES